MDHDHALPGNRREAILPPNTNRHNLVVGMLGALSLLLAQGLFLLCVARGWISLPFSGTAATVVETLATVGMWGDVAVFLLVGALLITALRE